MRDFANSGTSPIRNDDDLNEYSTTLPQQRKEKIKKIDLKTQELKKMEGMEDISNMFANAGNGSIDSDRQNPDGSKPEQVDRKKLEIMKKLNFRARDHMMVYKHRRSHDKLEVRIKDR